MTVKNYCFLFKNNIHSFILIENNTNTNSLKNKRMNMYTNLQHPN